MAVKKNKVLQKQSQDNSQFKGARIWRTVAILFTILFAAVLVAGLVRHYEFRKDFVKPTDAQIETARNSVTNQLNSLNLDPSLYQIEVSKWIRHINTVEGKKTTLQVSLRDSKSMEVYVVDVDRGQLLMRQKTEFYVASAGAQNGECLIGAGTRSGGLSCDGASKVDGSGYRGR